MKLRITVILCFLVAIVLSSCKDLPSKGMVPQDFANELSEFVAYNQWNVVDNYDVLTDEVDLYVDYSTCVAEAGKSDYYRTVHPVIVDCNPNYHSIKGSKIKFETNNRQQVYQLLNSVTEINYADIKSAIDTIVCRNNHAVLVTDGEYFLKGRVLDNLNNPYLSDSFRKWTQRGFDIYIYSEPYLESGRFNKFRYYIFFTDDRVENNIRERFDRSAPQGSNVPNYRISSKMPQVTRSKNYPEINISLSPNTDLKYNGANYDIQEYYTKWDKIYKYVLDNAYDDEGNVLESGDYILKGLKIKDMSNNAFKIEDLKVVTYNIGESFAAYQLAKLNEEELPAVTPLANGTKLFKIDEDLFNETGCIALYLNKGAEYDGLLSTPNLLKVDIMVDKVSENFTQNNDVNSQFQWQSISGSQSGLFNTSLYESIRQVLLDPNTNPLSNSKSNVIYTVYISTYGL
ncbi:MAG: hypothetical protein R3Y59_03980 [bacterium]